MHFFKLAVVTRNRGEETAHLSFMEKRKVLGVLSYVLWENPVFFSAFDYRITPLWFSPRLFALSYRFFHIEVHFVCRQ